MDPSRRARPTVDEDTRLLVASQRGGDGFDELYRRNVHLVLRWCQRRVLCPQTAAELTAETFARAFASRDRFDPKVGTAVGWLLGIAANLHRDWLRRRSVTDRARRRLGIHLPVLAEEDLEHIEALVDLAPLRAALPGALESLSPKLREAVVLRVALEWDYPTIAARLGCSVGAARVRVSRALRALHARLEREVT